MEFEHPVQSPDAGIRAVEKCVGVTSKKSWTDDEYDSYVANLDHIAEFSIECFETDDFYTNNECTIYNNRFYDGCTFLFVVWITPVQPVMVYNDQAVKGYATKKERDEEWVSIWESMFYRRTPDNMEWERAKVWKMVVDKMQPHMWMMWLGMY